MRRIDRWALIVALVGFSLVIAGLTWSPHGGGPSLVVDTSSVSFGPTPVGGIVFARFTLSNRTSVPIRIFGSSWDCVEGGCAGAENLPITIPGWGSAEVRIRVTPTRVCRFKATVKIYAECDECRTIPLEITGVILPKSDDHRSV